MSQEIHRLIPPQLYRQHFSQITFKTSFSNCVHQALVLRKWKEVDNNTWTLQWCEKQRINDVFEEGVSASQRVNHFRLYTQLCRKDMMIKNIRRYKRELGKQKKLIQQEWNFHPLTYFLPSEYIMFSDEFKRNGGIWILKPTGRCQGSGIFLVNKLSQVLPYKTKSIQENQAIKQNQRQTQQKKEELKKNQKKKEESQEQQSEKQQQQGQAPQNQNYIIQRYISNPLLFGSKKFDLRIYALCTNYSSLTIWLYRSGFARFTHEPYDGQNIQNLNSHLTNVEVQKHSENYDQIRGGKWLLNKFKHFLISKYGQVPTDKCFNGIKEIIIKTMESVQKSILPSKSSFQLYGYDFMIDNSLKPWLIEINGGPSMTANTQFDSVLKCGLIDDVLSIIDIQGILAKNENTVGGFDLILDQQTPVVQHKSTMYSCKLGCKNQRIKVMRKIAHNFLLRKKQNALKPKCEQQITKVNKRQKNAKPESNIQTKQKLLPNFYYARKPQEIDEEAKNILIQQLKLLQMNQDQVKPQLFEPIGAQNG